MLNEVSSLIRGVDLFCGVGGLTRGLEISGIPMSLGIDIDVDCEYPYSENNDSSFVLKPIEEFSADDLPRDFHDAPFKLLAGCAPCQPFSAYSRTWSSPADKRWNLLEQFSRLIREARPHLITMENVPPLLRHKVFDDFLAVLEHEGFEVSYSVVNCADYGVPQHRQRIVLLASTLGPIDLIPPTTPGTLQLTVRQSIGDMSPLSAGDVCGTDPLHQSSSLSSLNLSRIRSSKPGGTWRDWDVTLRAACHRRKLGKTYSGVYGRMGWDTPSPTLTTQFFGFGNGRFGHPEQDRAISLREGAMLQSFPKTYKFVKDDERIYRNRVGRLIGNAVPVKLGVAIGRSILLHIQNWLAFNSCTK